MIVTKDTDIKVYDYIDPFKGNLSSLVWAALCLAIEFGKCDDVVRGTCSGYYDT